MLWWWRQIGICQCGRHRRIWRRRRRWWYRHQHRQSRRWRRRRRLLPENDYDACGDLQLCGWRRRRCWYCIKRRFRRWGRRQRHYHHYGISLRMRLIPIPPTHEALNETFRHWAPFLDDISRRSKQSIDDLLAQIARHDVQIALVWDGQQAHALIGMRFHYRGEELVGEIVWLVGRGMKQWRHLLPELERYLKDYVGCKVIRPICRKGWSRQLLKAGYKTTHLMMEKVL